VEASLLPIQAELGFWAILTANLGILLGGMGRSPTKCPGEDYLSQKRHFPET